MVVVLLIGIMLAELVVMIGLALASRTNDELAPLIFGWVLGAFTAATSFTSRYSRMFVLDIYP